MTDQVIAALIGAGVVVVGWIVTAVISYKRDKAYDKHVSANAVLDDAIQILLSLKADWAQIKERAFWNKMEFAEISLLRVSRKAVYVTWCAIEEELLDYFEASNRMSQQIDNEVDLILDNTNESRTREEIIEQLVADYENSDETIDLNRPPLDDCIHRLIDAEAKPYSCFTKMLVAAAVSNLPGCGRIK